jgi:nucleoside-diphosphate-sugar epimerase
MGSPSSVVLGSTGLVGRAVAAALETAGVAVIGVHSSDYAAHVGAAADALINCNGNTYRYKAAKDPGWDFSASVATVARSLFDFRVDRYIYISTIDVYNRRAGTESTREETPIDCTRLEPYAFHKWIAERLVERHAARATILRCGTVIGPALKKGPVYDILHGRPLHMTAESTLSLVDTETIAAAVRAVLDDRIEDRIVNVTGTGSVSVGTLGELAGRPVAGGAADLPHYEYDINNERLRAIIPVATSAAIAARFIRHWNGDSQ